MYENVSGVILSHMVGVTTSRVTTILTHCLSTYYSQGNHLSCFFFLIFSKFIKLIVQLAWILVTTILYFFMVALVRLIENVTKSALIFDHVLLI